jgi:hypothetical protein
LLHETDSKRHRGRQGERRTAATWRTAAPAVASFAKWLLCRYPETALELICYGLGRATRPATMPETLFEEGRGATFGGYREIARRLAATAKMDGNAWGARFFARFAVGADVRTGNATPPSIPAHVSKELYLCCGF